MYNAKLCQANSRGAHLSNVYLQNADLTDANFSNASLKNTKFGNNKGMSQLLETELELEEVICEDETWILF